MANNIAERFYAGTSGLVLPVRNKSQYPPEFQDKSKLNYYASLFNSVEINSSFYKIPMASTVRKWDDSVPDNFRFTFKLWRDITHNKQLTFNPDDVRRFIEVINEVGHKRGCLLIQFPPSSSIANARQLEYLLSELAVYDPENTWMRAVEFRNRSWYEDDVYEMLSIYNAGMVIHDLPASNSPVIQTSDTFVYLRFHGPDGSYRGTYTADFLYEYALYVKEWMEEGRSVYVYFNNTMGEASNNLLTLKKHVNELLSIL